MVGKDVTIPARDGYRLAATWHDAGGDVAVSIQAGTGVKRQFYDRFAAHVAAQGLSTLTFDYRGIGGSRPARLRGFSADMLDWARRDAAGALGWLREQGHSRLRIVGHSFGGQAVGLLPEDARVGIEKVLLVNAQSGSWRRWHARHRPLMVLLWHGILPASTQLLGRFPGRLMGGMQDLPRGVALQWARWARHRDYILRQPARAAGYAAWRVPLRAYSFSDDALYAPRPAVEQLLSWFRGADVEHRHLAPEDLGHPVGHFGFFRPSSADTLWPEATDWLA